ncbi:hypothetical protein GOBAR_AA31333 [Gossypium barbadense]|uniref:RNase H type-1 domain-containing protein n=1 Tax=Gossypium barbadense TaxID=3634 RepID=A0A2P5WE44_GOSBA|nr:hypothetical protein GOBAR_AA31333 [Gossypium barbadense]
MCFEIAFLPFRVWNRLLVCLAGTYNDSDLVSWLGFLCQAHTWDKLALILTTIWALWWSRNMYYHEGPVWTSIESVSFIQSYMGGLSMLAVPGTVSAVLRTARWHPPTAPIRGSHSSCSGVVVQDAQRHVLGACTRMHATIVCHCFIEQNRVAHQLAPLGFRWTSDHFWVEEILFSVEGAVVADGRSSAPLP